MFWSDIITADGRKGTERTLSFMSGKHGTDHDASRVIEVANTIPGVKALVKCQSTAELKDMLDALNPLCFPLLRWIITSNRTHLELLPAQYVCYLMNVFR